VRSVENLIFLIRPRSATQGYGNWLEAHMGAEKPEAHCPPLGFWAVTMHKLN
jgi:hypothetical protein